MMDENTLLHGVWIPGQGWLKGKDVFADANRDKALEVARLIGRGASVRFIDPSIVDLEQLYLENEKRTLWHTFRNWLQRKNSKSANSK